jgi:hypothetical protein
MARLTVALSESFSRFTVRASLAHASTSKSRAAPFYIFSPETFSVFSPALAAESFGVSFSALATESSAVSAFAFPLKSSTMPTTTLFSFSPSFNSSFNFSFFCSSSSPALIHIPEQLPHLFPVVFTVRLCQSSEPSVKPPLRGPQALRLLRAFFHLLLFLVSLGPAFSSLGG